MGRINYGKLGSIVHPPGDGVWSSSKTSITHIPWRVFLFWRANPHANRDPWAGSGHLGFVAAVCDRRSALPSRAGIERRYNDTDPLRASRLKRPARWRAYSDSIWFLAPRRSGALDILNVNGVGRAVQGPGDLDLLSGEVLGLGLVVELVGGFGPRVVQDIFAAACDALDSALLGVFGADLLDHGFVTAHHGAGAVHDLTRVRLSCARRRGRS